MLRRLFIRDFILIDRLELEFGAGFGALTGETGAGKSILVDALALLMGARADGAVVRQGAGRAEIAAEFDLQPSHPGCEWLLEQDIEIEHGALSLRRVIEAEGRSRAYINGVSVTLSQLRELGDGLVDLHGQHAHHALLKESAQRALFDAHAGLSGQLAQMSQLFRDWRRLAEALEAAQSDAQRFDAEREVLAWQVKELRDLAFSVDEWQQIQGEQRRLAHAAQLIDGVGNALAMLDEGEPAALALLERIGCDLARLESFDAQLTEARALAESSAAQAAELVRLLRGYRSRQDLDPAVLVQIEARMADIVATARKHRCAPEELPALLETLAARLAAVEAQVDVVALERQCSVAQTAYRRAAEQVSQVRAQAAPVLSAQVSELLSTLAMGGARFEVRLVPHAAPMASGLEAVEFCVSTNPGQTPGALSRVASGGELSRIGLAIQVIASTAGGSDTLVFDEVDVGVGGRVAEVVGRLLRRLGRARQVLCVTHLPQVAAQADWQWSIAKLAEGEQMRTCVRQLDEAARVEELARMLGGERITDTTRNHAREMRAMADASAGDSA